MDPPSRENLFVRSVKVPREDSEEDEDEELASDRFAGGSLVCVRKEDGRGDVLVQRPIR